MAPRSASADHILDVHHTGLSVHDLSAMTRWYQQALGMEVEERFEPAEGVSAALLGRPGGLRLELIHLQGSSPDEQRKADPGDSLLRHGWGHVCVRVDDIDRAFETLAAAGATKVSPPAPAPFPGCHYAFVTDPEGNQIELLSQTDAT